MIDYLLYRLFKVAYIIIRAIKFKKKSSRNFIKTPKFLPFMEIQYEKYRWFFTSSNKLVVGGKSAEQNDDLLKKLKSQSRDFVVMHTSSPGSPFSVIIEKKSEVSPEDIKEAAIFTACFSQQWRSRVKSTSIDVFSLFQVSKSALLKTGTWQVKGKIKKIKVKLELYLTEQEGKLRAVPFPKGSFVKIVPGGVDKEKAAISIKKQFPKFSKEDIMSALPSYGINIS